MVDCRIKDNLTTFALWGAWPHLVHHANRVAAARVIVENASETPADSRSASLVGQGVLGNPSAWLRLGCPDAHQVQGNNNQDAGNSAHWDSLALLHRARSTLPSSTRYLCALRCIDLTLR
jgi:hypothetical protein